MAKKKEIGLQQPMMVSLNLQKEFPNVDGFSASNLWRMKQWFLFYSSEPEKLAQGVRELQDHKATDAKNKGGLRLWRNQR
ncbi:MAG: hypothetical protein IKX36_05485 [Prevotella sp.]|nr:hypothetical protein [Prevotella sp.]